MRLRLPPASTHEPPLDLLISTSHGEPGVAGPLSCLGLFPPLDLSPLRRAQRDTFVRTAALIVGGVWGMALTGDPKSVAVDTL